VFSKSSGCPITDFGHDDQDDFNFEIGSRIHILHYPLYISLERRYQTSVEVSIEMKSMIVFLSV